MLRKGLTYVSVWQQDKQLSLYELQERKQGLLGPTHENTYPGFNFQSILEGLKIKRKYNSLMMDQPKAPVYFNHD